MNYEAVIDALTLKIKNMEDKIKEQKEFSETLILRGETMCVAIHNKRDQNVLEESADYFRELYRGTKGER
jgi:hypothetical protein